MSGLQSVPEDLQSDGSAFHSDPGSSGSCLLYTSFSEHERNTTLLSALASVHCSVSVSYTHLCSVRQVRHSDLCKCQVLQHDSNQKHDRQNQKFTQIHGRDADGKHIHLLNGACLLYTSDKKKLEQAKKRLADLDVIIARLYEDYVLGNLNQDRYRKMSADYEAEQERLKLEIEVIEEWVEQREEMNDGLDAFIALTQKYVDVEELTQTIVNEYIKKIIVYAPDKSSGKRKQKVKIFFNFVDDVDIPVISEPIITQTTYEHRKTA